MSMKHLYRLILLLAGSMLLLGWVVKHMEPTTNIGLRYIRQAERIERGSWRDGLFQGIDHPLHPLGIAAAHRLFDGDGPGSWQRAALLFSFTCAVLLVVPIYLLTYELCGENTAWLAAALVTVNPLNGFDVVNVLSESSFMLWWSFGLWVTVRFLREGRFIWLPPAIGFGALAYLTRPEGMLLPVALAATLLILPLVRATRINWPRWWRALVFVLGGLLFLVGPYIAIKGGLGTKPGIARVLGLEEQSQPLALEREHPLPPDQTSFETYRLATARMLEAHAGAVTFPLLPFSLIGLLLAVRSRARVRAWLFLGIVLAVSAVALVRLHATGGYLTARHALVPGTILTLAAASGLTWLTSRISIPGRWLGLAHEQFRPGPAVWAVLVALLLINPYLRSLGPFLPGPFSVYHTTGEWLAQNTRADDEVLDLTDWSLYFSRRAGYRSADVYEAPADPKTRWIVVPKPIVEVDWHYRHLVGELIGGREAVALIPPDAGPNQMQIRIYDRRGPGPLAATMPNPPGADSRRR
ncbi:MAG: glycosyltransferase family 39 protein [Isosphaerales bacterium]